MKLARTLTQLLRQWSEGDQDAAAEAMPLVYDELHRLAKECLRRERPGHPLQATDIVHEVYLEIRAQDPHWTDRAHFIGLTVHMMRRILVRYTRKHNAARRGGGQPCITLVEDATSAEQRPPDLLALDEALRTLAELDRQKASIVELHYFGGLTLDEVATVTGISRPTVVRELRRSRTWLYRELKKGEGNEP